MGIRGLVLAVALIGLTMGTAQAYRLKHTESGGAVRWDARVENVELRVSREVERFLPHRQAYEAITMAADAWRGFGNVPTIKITGGEAPAYNPDRRGGAIYVLSPWPFEENRLAVTVTSFYPSGQLVGVDVLINGEVDYSMLPELAGEVDDDLPKRFRGKHDLAAVLTHEFGHVLGLDESTDDPEATMWPYIRAGETHQRTLSADDEDAVVDLYQQSALTTDEQALSVAEVPPAACSVSVMGASEGSSRGLSRLIGIAGLAWITSRSRRRNR